MKGQVNKLKHVSYSAVTICSDTNRPRNATITGFTQPCNESIHHI